LASASDEDMKRVIRVIGVFTLATLVSLAAPQDGRADAFESFTNIRNLTLVVGANAGGGYDAYGRLFARYFSRHFPGDAAVIIQSMPGASGRRAAEYMYSVAPKDGSVMGTLEQNIPLTQILGRDNVRFDVGRFNYIGNMSATISAAIAWHTTGVRTIDDAKQTALIVGATGETGTTEVFARLMNRTLGTKFRVVSGYKGGNDINLAMQRGEVGGRASISWASLKSASPDWLADSKVHVLVQIGLRKAPDLPDVPLLMDLVSDPTDREVVRLFSASLQLGRVVVAPPGVPEERVTLLRATYDAALADPGLRADARRMQIDVDSVRGVDVQKVISSLIAEPPEVIEKAKTITQ
jgi:tripartite-type tricarboxylate transporter receptor subunit TctC